ncbi:hypothetical protein UFOVP270_44 [uncultured Caudovirales phage]|uniref:Uncharacterized protein n=1 Tax=uncultured Caudovirales phage TaxID=2100421 RepID=A0A6J5LN00_9CAUD|nr:hypothetical protein UFOVP270_44 [uncultured Caudovirales phage]
MKINHDKEGSASESEFKALLIAYHECNCLVSNLEKELLYLKLKKSSKFSYEYFVEQLHTLYSPIWDMVKKDYEN